MSDSSVPYVVYSVSPFRGHGRQLVRLLAVLALLGAIAAIVLFVLSASPGHSATRGRAATPAAGGQAAARGGARAKARASATARAKARTRSTHQVASAPASVGPASKAGRTTRRQLESRAAATLPAPSATPVAVLNSNGVGGAASTMAARLRAFGYPTPTVGNARRTGLPSAIEYRHGFGTAARALQRRLGNVTYVGPLDGPSAKSLGGAVLVVIVGA